MNRKSYDAPKLFQLGTVKELTEGTPDPEEKCGGSGDQFLPQLLSPNYSNDCP